MGTTRRVAIRRAVAVAAGAAVSPAAARAVSAADDPAAFCAAAGGSVVERTALQHQNDPTALLASTAAFCELTGGQGADPASSVIALDAASLAAAGPTLATLAYRGKRPMPAISQPVNDQGTPMAVPNPASLYCQLAGGAEWDWFAKDAAADRQTVTMCVFPDRSAIDSWGLAYHGMGTIRGADLSPLMGWKGE